MFLWIELSAINMIKDINIDITAIKKLERKSDAEKLGTKIFIIPPAKMIGIVPIKIDLYNLLDKTEW